MNIKPEIIKALRNARGWTQEQLGEAAKLDKTTISRIERGSHDDRRGSTAEKLSKAFGVDLKVLTGEAPIPEKRSMLFEKRSTMTLEVDDAARNALTLTAARYGVAQAQIVELAPFLFSWAAESSLKRRAEALTELAERTAAVDALQARMPHTSSILGYSPLTEDLVAAEERSIRRRDLFASDMLEQDTGDILKADFEESEDGPSVTFLRDLAKDAPEALSFDDWSPRAAPNYKVSREQAIGLFGADAEVVDAILDGFVSLAKLPADLRPKAMLKERQDWARRERQAYLERLDEEFRTLGIDLDQLVGVKTVEVAQ